jgi:hypothetical protein
MAPVYTFICSSCSTQHFWGHYRFHRGSPDLKTALRPMSQRPRAALSLRLVTSLLMVRLRQQTSSSSVSLPPSCLLGALCWSSVLLMPLQEVLPQIWRLRRSVSAKAAPNLVQLQA